MSDWSVSGPSVRGGSPPSLEPRHAASGPGPPAPPPGRRYLAKAGGGSLVVASLVVVSSLREIQTDRLRAASDSSSSGLSLRPAAA